MLRWFYVCKVQQQSMGLVHPTCAKRDDISSQSPCDVGCPRRTWFQHVTGWAQYSCAEAGHLWQRCDRHYRGAFQWTDGQPPSLV